jgi:hypothetical protein
LLRSWKAHADVKKNMAKLAWVSSKGYLFPAHAHVCEE